MDLVDVKYKRSVIINYIIKVISVGVGFYSVKLILAFLGSETYGLWMTISSIASWAAMGNLGIGNGAKNELSKAYAQKDINKQRNIIATSIKTLICVSTCVFIIITMISEVLIAVSVIEEASRLAIYITNIFTCVNLVMSIFSSMAYAYQFSHLPSLSQLCYSLLIIGVVLIFRAAEIKGGLLVFSIICGLSSLCSNIILYCFVKRYINIKISIKKDFSLEVKDKILKVGIRFFIIQLCCIILYSTDNLIINKLYGGELVTKYSIINKVFTMGEELFAILLISVWTAVTYQWQCNNYDWIRKKIKQLLYAWGIFSIGAVLVGIGFNLLIRVWFGSNNIYYEGQLLVIFVIYSICGTFGSIYVNVANGIGIIKLQVVMSSIEAIINIPLSIVLANGVGMGIAGVKLATLFCCFGANIVMPIYITKLLKRKNLDNNVNIG